MLKVILFGFMTILLAACNLLAEPESSPIPPTDTQVPTVNQIQSEIMVTPTIELPTITIEFQQLPTSSFDALRAASETPVPIGVRLPTQQVNIPVQITDVPTDNPTAGITMPFPETFNDEYQISAGQGRIIYVTYEVVVNNPGTGRVFIEIRDPAGEAIGQLVLTETETAEYEVTTNTAGSHQLLVTSQNLRGYYSVGYGTR